MLYLPATSFIMPPSETQLRAVRDFARKHDINTAILLPPLAPEAQFPTAIEDVTATLAAMPEHFGVDPGQIVINAASAGAAIGLAATVAVRDRGLPLPGGLVLMSPWLDLTLSGWSYVTRGLARQSPFRLEFIAFCAKLYLGDAFPGSPLASPLYADLDGLPPVLVHASRRDIYFDDAVRFVDRALEANVPARINYWDDSRHFLEQFSTPEADQSLSMIAAFIHERIGDRNGAA